MQSRLRLSRTRTLGAVTAVVTVVVLVGCGSDTDEAAQGGDGDAATASPSPSSSPTEEESESPSPTPEPDPTTAEPTPEFTPLAPEDAADGTDVDACADGACEVAVTVGTSIPFDPEVGGVTVAEISANQVTLAMTYSSGGSGSMQVGVGPEGGSFGNVNTMIIDFAVLGIEDGTAVMSFAPGEL
ncbi:hypothetical protein [Streptomyces sp. B6B3]|uniref:hypothetical protein n=1 Tax=Streptomyces sp. B6B3 TaxID=3153570 RepID=UPI00325C955C